jgi:hypothetical protein
MSYKEIIVEEKNIKKECMFIMFIVFRMIPEKFTNRSM